MARRLGPGGIRIMIEPTDVSVYTISQQLTGDGMRWRELVHANPAKPRGVSGGFQTLTPGETLCIPASWAESADAKGLEVSEAVDAAGLFDLDEAGALPYGFTKNDAWIIGKLAEQWNVSTDDILVTFYEESGLQPHKMTDVGSGTAPDGRPRMWYGGLIGGLAEMWDGTKRVFVIDTTFGWPAGTWEKIVTTTPIATQLQAIANIWDRQFKTTIPGKLTVRQFADRMGVSPAAVIHAINYVPAFMSRIQNADSPITKQGEKGGFYEGNAGPKFSNWGLDVNRDGNVSLRDLDLHGQQKLAELEKSNLGSLVAEARSDPKPPETLASLFSPIEKEWKGLTGKPAITTVGWNEPKGGAAGGMLLAGLLGLGLWYYSRKA